MLTDHKFVFVIKVLKRTSTNSSYVISASEQQSAMY